MSKPAEHDSASGIHIARSFARFAIRLTDAPADGEVLSRAPGRKWLVRIGAGEAPSDLELALTSSEEAPRHTALGWLKERDGDHHPLSVTAKDSHIVLGESHGLIASSKSEMLVRPVAAVWAIRKELAGLERAIADCWTIARQDIPLTHAVSRKQLAKGEHVNTMTVRVTMLRFRLIELSRFATEESFEPASDRIFDALLEAMNFEDRLQSLDDFLEAMEDLYELANDRLTEYTFFRREYRLELLILLVLVIEVLQIFAEMFILAR